MNVGKILIVEDESDVAELLAYNLTKEGYEPIIAREGITGLQRSRDMQPDIVILDLMLPGMGGWEVFRRLKSERTSAHIPVIILTARANEADKVLGLELGADDYITKPFSLREMLARIRTVLRRRDSGKDPQQPEVIQSGQLRIDRGRFEVTVNGKVAPLTTKEFGLLYALATNRGRVLSRDRLLDLAWGEEGFVEPRTVDVHMTRLRTKLSERSESERYIETVRGVGYRFRDQPVAVTIPQQDAKLRLAHSSKWRNESKVKAP